jgi:predicted DNA-binding transcriptional regulator AlpA
MWWLDKPKQLVTIEDFEAEAKRLEANEKAQYQEHKEACRLEGRFCDATPSELIHMFKHSVNEHGRPLSQFEFEALCEQWLIQFGQLPPDSAADEREQSDEQPEPTTEELEDQLDDTMLLAKDVVRLTGVSRTWLYRAVRDGEFPEPTRLPTGRKGWPAHKVKAWKAGLDVDPKMRDLRRLPNAKR